MRLLGHLGPLPFALVRNMAAPAAMTLLAVVLASAGCKGAPPPVVASAQDSPPAAAPAANLSGLHDFDLRAGNWTTHHRVLKERLADSHDWMEYDGTQTFWPLMGGFANVDEQILDKPGGAYRGVTLRAYDPKTGQWAIWWLDGRNPFGALDPPMKGHFENGVGTFYADDTLRGKPVRVRFIWSQITATAAHWEQACSPDGGKTWETNWFCDFRKAP
jgi:hypothetical protein